MKYILDDEGHKIFKFATKAHKVMRHYNPRYVELLIEKLEDETKATEYLKLCLKGYGERIIKLTTEESNGTTDKGRTTEATEQG